MIRRLCCLANLLSIVLANDPVSLAAGGSPRQPLVVDFNNPVAHRGKLACSDNGE
jgi:hypothetical protein